MCITNIVPSANTSFVADFIDFINVQSNNTASQAIVTGITVRVALPIFALIDATYHLTAVVIQFPFVVLELSVAS